MSRHRLLTGLGVIGAHAVIAATYAATAGHSSWLYHSSAGQIESGTAATMLSNLSLPVTDGGFLWSMLTAPALGLLGPDLLRALPVVVVAGAAVLAPLATLLVFRLGRRLGGTRWALWVTAVWLVAPLAAHAFWQDRYDAVWSDAMVSRLLGFSATSDALSLVLLLSAAVLTMAALRSADRSFAPVGVAVGAAATVTPSNLLILVGVAGAALVARRPRALTWVGAGLLPGLLLLLVWRLRMPGEGLGLSLDLSWQRFSSNADAFREFGWSERIVEAAPVAGLVGLARLSRPGAALLGGWLAAFLAIEMSASERQLGDGTLWAGLAASAPAFAMLVASIPLLVPGVAGRLHLPAAEPSRTVPVRPARFAAFALLFGAALLWMLAARDGRLGREAVFVEGVLTPVTASALVPRLDGTDLTWSPLERRARAGYRLVRPVEGDASWATVPGGDATTERAPLPADVRAARVVAIASPPETPRRAYLAGPALPAS